MRSNVMFPLVTCLLSSVVRLEMISFSKLAALFLSPAWKAASAVVFGGVDFAVNQPVKIGFKGDQHHLFSMGDAGTKLASGSLRK